MGKLRKYHWVSYMMNYIMNKLKCKLCDYESKQLFHHFNSDGTLKDKDIQRQKEIEEYLGCKFIRINYDR